MARLFDDAQTEGLIIDQAVLSGTPLAMVCWVFINDASPRLAIMTIHRVEDVLNAFYLDTNYAGSDRIRAITGSSVTSAAAITSSGYSLNTWHHACGIFASPTDRRVFIDGGSKGTDATNLTPAGLNNTTIGIQKRSDGLIMPMSGMIAEAAIYDLSVWPGANDAERADNFEKILPSLAASYTPKHFPLGRVAYWNLVRGLNDETGGYNLTATGTVVAAHPRIISPCGVL